MGSGVKIGANYAKFSVKKVVTGKTDKTAFHEATAKETYKTFSSMKGAPLKLAQMLSMDKNLIPEQYADEFAQAQYSAPPLSHPLVVKTFQKEMGKSPKDIFDTFTKSAVAGASIGQVHKASLNGEELAVKIQYPGVAKSLNSDLAIVKPLAIQLFNLDSESIEPYLEEIKSRLLEETDYIREREVSERLIAQSSHLPFTHFPSFRKDLSSQRILTMTWIDGMPLDKFAESDAPQDIKNRIAQAIWDFYDHQIHTLHVFHADPHPGNFLVKDGELYVIDFGCVKTLPEDFYQKYFKLMDPEILSTENEEEFHASLRYFNLLLEKDTVREMEIMTKLFRESISLLSQPFYEGEFDFGDDEYFQELADFGERTRLDAEVKKISQARGSAHALYLNRTYFGIYNLCGMLQAKVQTKMSWLDN